MAHYEKYDKNSIAKQFNHDSRKNTEKRDRIDKERSHLNYNLCDIEDPIEYNKRLVEMIKEQGGRIRKDSVYMCSLIITLPKDFPDNPTLQEQFFKSAKRGMDEIHGKENCLSCWVHLDEAQPHMHYRFCPRKLDKEKNKYKLCAKEILNRNFLKSFHNKLSDYMEEELGFKVSILNGATKEIGGHKEVEELIAISEELEKTRDIIENSPTLILAEQKKILNEYWQEYKEVSNIYWKEYKAKKQQIKNELWELKKGIWGNEKQLKRDLDFIDNLNKKGFILALFRLITALLVSTRKNTLKDKQRELEGKLGELEKARQSISNYQHNAKEYLKKKDFENIEIALDKWETAVLSANEEIRDLFRKSEIEQNRGVSERNKDIEEIDCL